MWYACKQELRLYVPSELGLMPVFLRQVFVEQADLAELEKTREESQADMDMHLAETNAALETMRKEVSSPAGKS